MIEDILDSLWKLFRIPDSRLQKIFPILLKFFAILGSRLRIIFTDFSSEIFKSGITSSEDFQGFFMRGFWFRDNRLPKMFADCTPIFLVSEITDYGRISRIWLQIWWYPGEEVATDFQGLFYKYVGIRDIRLWKIFTFFVSNLLVY